MVGGVAGAPGLRAEQAPGKGGGSATTLHQRMEVPRVQGGKCRPRLAEGLWVQARTNAADVNKFSGYWLKTSFG